jgi:uncharacterized membrane protein
VATISRDPDRLVLFTDAVVAIAITLLVLPLVEAVSEPATSALELISHNQDRIWSFLLSFAVIARFWLLHHRIFEHVKAYNSALIWLNMAWLLTIVFLPFPTGLIGEHGDDHFTKAFYVGCVLASSLAQTILIVLIYRSKDLQDDNNPLSATNTASAVLSSCLLVVAFLLTTFVPGVGYLSILVLLLTRPVMALRRRVRPESSSG